MNKMESFLNKIYKPRIKLENRKKLLRLSIITLSVVILLALLQYSYNWTNDGIYYVCVMFGVMSIIGLLVAKHANDFWVALVYGEWKM